MILRALTFFPFELLDSHHYTAYTLLYAKS